MEDPIHFSKFSKSEAPYFERFQRWRDKVLRPFCAWLTRVGFKPDHITYFSLALFLPFLFFLRQMPLLSIVSLALSLILDMVDGPLARHQKIASDRGFFLDFGVDHAVFFGVLLALIYVKTIDGFFGAFYGLNYLLMILFTMILSALKVETFTVFRTKYYFFLFWGIAVVSGYNFLDIFLVFFSIYMFLTNLFLFHKFRCSLQS